MRLESGIESVIMAEKSGSNASRHRVSPRLIAVDSRRGSIERALRKIRFDKHGHSLSGLSRVDGFARG